MSMSMSKSKSKINSNLNQQAPCLLLWASHQGTHSTPPSSSSTRLANQPGSKNVRVLEVIDTNTATRWAKLKNETCPTLTGRSEQGRAREWILDIGF